MKYSFKNKKGKEVLGWLSDEEAEILYDLAIKAPSGKILELGTFVGKSAIVLASAMKKKGGVLTCIDYFAPDMVIEIGGLKQIVPDTLKVFWENIDERQLQKHVVTLKGDYKNILPTLSGKFGLIFIDGGHDFKNTSFAAEKSWGLLAEEGFLIFHDYNNKSWPDVRVCVDVCRKKWGRDFVRTSKNLNLVALQK